MTVILREPFAQSWSEAEAFERVRELQGTVIRNKEGRRTLRFEFAGSHYYLKHHSGIGWGEILKNWSQFKTPVTGATNEWQAINQLRELGLDTLNPVAFGIQGKDPARRESFLITEELTGTVSLAKYAESWPLHPPAFSEKRQLIETVARIARTLHRQGINHRDLYICHFLLNPSASRERGEPVLHVVDLHRAQCRKHVPLRWRIKDLASIYFSALDIGLTRCDVFRFLEVYFDKPLHSVLRDERNLLLAIQRRAVRLYRRDFQREPVTVL